MTRKFKTPAVDGDPIAIVGLACRLPGNCESPSSLWKLLVDGKTGRGPIPPGKSGVDSFLRDVRVDGQKNGQKLEGYYLQKDTRAFDNNFFGIHGAEATYMDPQQRNLLEVVYECFESAGVRLDQVSGSNIGCYVGNFTQDFAHMQTRDLQRLNRHSATGMGSGMLSNRISHAFNMAGPSLVIDTACSSSVYCLHIACSALDMNECDAAVVAGANLIQSVEQYIAMDKTGVISPTMTCHTFSQEADGYVRAEGVCALYIKRLKAALQNNDPIRAVIRGSAVGSNGKTAGISAPDVEAQTRIIRQAYRKANLDQRETSYIECHGTGTPKGDPVEIEALSKVFVRDSDHPLFIGSIKPNIGHGEGVSGLSSIIKTVLALEAHQIPPTVNVHAVNPQIKLADYNFEIVEKNRVWAPVTFSGSSFGGVRRAGVNSFGYGGANGHVIIEAADMWTHPRSHSRSKKSMMNGDTPSNRMAFLLLFSAASMKSLKSRVSAIESKDLDIPHLAYTLACRRTHFPCRGYMTVRKDNIAEDLRLESLKVLSSPSQLDQAPLAFVFTGQGAQWAGMGRELFDDYAVFRQSIRHMDTILQQLAHPPIWSIEGVLHDDSPSSPINKSSYSQPITTALQIAITDLLSSLDVHPSFVIGHSSGEIAAAFAAGHITMKQAIIAAYYRGYVNEINSKDGAMLAVGLTVSEAVTKIRELHMENNIKVGCHNSPGNVTVTGDTNAILQLSEALQARDVFARKLKTGGKAYHSQHMIALGPMLEQLLQSSSSNPATPKDPTSVVEFFSTVTAKRKESDFDASYWRTNMESPVLFHESVEYLLEKRSMKFVEIGPHSALELPIRQIIAGLGREKEKLFYCPSQRRGKNGTQCIHDLLGQLYLHNHSFSFGNINADGTGPQLQVIHDLPSYPWDHGRLLWSEPRISSELRTLRQAHHELLGAMIPGGDGRFMQWKNELRLEDVPWLGGHQIQDTVIFPAAGYIAMAAEAVTQVAGLLDTPTKIELRKVSFSSALVLGDTVELFTTLRPKSAFPAHAASCWWEYEINSYQNGSSSSHCKGSIMVQKHETELSSTRPASIFTPQSLAPQVFYPVLARKGLNFTGKFRSLKSVHGSMIDGPPFPRSVISWLKQNNVENSSYIADPILIDAMLQAGIIANAGNSVSNLETMIPVSLESAVVIVQSKYGQGLAEFVQAYIDERANGITLDAELIDVKDRTVATLKGVRMTFLSPPSSNQPAIKRQLAANIVWKPAVFLSSWTVHDISGQIDRVFACNHRLATDLPLAELQKSLHVLSLLNFALPTFNVLDICDSLIVESTARHETLCSNIVPSNYYIGSMSGNRTIDMFQPISENTADTELQLRALNQRKTYDVIILSSNMSEQELNFIVTFLSPNGFVLTSLVNMEQPKLPTCKLWPHSQIAEAVGEWLERSKLTSTITLNGLKPDADILIIEPDCPGPATVALGTSVAHLLGSKARRLSISQLAESDVPQKAVIISTVEVEKPLLSSITDAELNKVKILTNRASKIIWISGDSVLESSNPDFALVSGLSRTLMLEQPSLSFFVFHLTQHDIESPHTANHILSVLKQEPGGLVDYEFAQENGVLHISRVTWDAEANERFQRCSEEPKTLRQVESDHLVLPHVDLASDVPLKMPEISAPGLSDGFVEVEVSMIGLSSYDRSLNMNAFHDEDSIWLNNFCGSVSRVGRIVSDVSVGDQVVVMAPCKLRPFQTVPSWACLKLRDNDQVETVAAIPYVYSTASLALNHRARIQAGETIFIQDGASAIGIAAILISQLAGAHVLISVHSPGERDLLTQKLHLDESQIFICPDDSVVDFVHTATEGYGADVVFLVDGQIPLNGWTMCAPFGRFLLIGSDDTTKVENMVMEDCSRQNVTCFAVNLAEVFYNGHPKSRKIWSKLLKDTMTLYWDGQITSSIQVKKYTIDAIAKALEASSDGTANFVTVCLEVSNGSAHSPRYQTNLDPSKSYVIVGGFGGIGSAITLWMLSRGARRFLLIGRSADSKNKGLVPYLETQGAHVKLFRCNIADQDEVRRCLLSEEDNIGGVIHSAMDLQESVFAEMTGKAWRTGIGTKVQGCWNLHNVLEERHIRVDFFVLISSTYGSFGGIAQSNYCAANHFLDQFARYRRSLGLPAVSLGLGILSDVGYISENPEIESKLKRSGISNLNHEDMLLLLDIALGRAAQCFDIIDQAHILTGIEQGDYQEDGNNRSKGSSIFTNDPRARSIDTTMKSLDQSSEPTTGHSSDLSRAASKELLTDKAVTALINETLAEFFSVEASTVIGSKSLVDYGMDSMLATEIRTWLYRTFNVEVSLFKILSKTTTAESLTALTMEAFSVETVNE